MTEQEPLFFEDVYDAYKHAVQRLGGAKKVGDMLFPDKGPDKAAEYLLACLNRDRNEKLSLEQLALIRREARKIGCHTVAAFEADDAGYADPQPIEPEDEKAELQRNFIERVDSLQAILRKMEKFK